MEIIIAFLVFTIGTVFGSFFTLAVYRIPLKKDITHERSFCPNCNHRLEFLDLIPVWSYLFLRGKCRYCKEKVRPRYLILEVMSGLIFLIQYLSLDIDIVDITYLFCGINYCNITNKMIYFIFFICFYITNAIILGINKEYKNISVNVLVFGVITQILYLVYMYFYMKIHLISIIAIIITILLLIINIKLKKEMINNFAFIFYEISFLGYIKTFIFIILVLVVIGLALIKNKIKKEDNKNTIYGFFIGISAIISQVLLDFFV